MNATAAKPMTVSDAVRWGTSELERSDEPAPRARAHADAALLLRHALGISSAELHAHGERLLAASEELQFRVHIHDRRNGRPIQYIAGWQEFFGLRFDCTPEVLIPRPETELLVETAIARLGGCTAPRIADVGTGSGVIAVALAHALPRSHIAALDISPAALAVAARNARRNQVAERIRFVASNLLDTVQRERFDAIVSNPPYVALGERSSLPREVREYEPAAALFAGAKGTEFHRRLIQEAAPLLVPGGWLLMEIGHGQQPAIREMLRGWNAVEFLADLQGIPRVAAARKPDSAQRSERNGAMDSTGKRAQARRSPA